MEERVLTVSVGGQAGVDMWLAGISRLQRVRYRLVPGNQGVGAIGRGRQKLRGQELVKTTMRSL